MEKIQENEQWKLRGDCSKCRRNNYCRAACTRHKRADKAKFKRIVVSAMNEMTGGAMREIIEKTMDAI